MKTRLLITFFLLCRISAEGQFLHNPVIIDAKLQTGMNLPFYKALDYLIKNDIYSFDLSLSFAYNRDDYWKTLYRNPVTGAGYSFYTLGNREVFGNAHAVYGYFRKDLTSGRIRAVYRVSAGGALLPKSFDITENPLNRAIGSKLNIFFRLEMYASLKLSDRTELTAGAGAAHFSNGKTKSPNYGINAGTIFLGLSHLSGPIPVKEIGNDPDPVIKDCIQSVSFAAGSKVYDNLLGTRYFASSISYNAEKCIGKKHRIGFGADIFYDGSIKEAMADEDGTPETNMKFLVRAGLNLSYSTRYRNLVAGLQAGHYIYSPYHGFTLFYNRLYIKYILTPHISAGIAIKSHWGKADCLEYGVSYYW